MGWFSSLYDKIKSTVNTVSNAISNAMPGATKIYETIKTAIPTVEKVLESPITQAVASFVPGGSTVLNAAKQAKEFLGGNKSAEPMSVAVKTNPPPTPAAPKRVYKPRTPKLVAATTQPKKRGRPRKNPV